MDDPLYEALGMSSGVVYAGQSQEEKKEAYGADITYGTNNEFGLIICETTWLQRRRSCSKAAEFRHC